MTQKFNTQTNTILSSCRRTCTDKTIASILAKHYENKRKLIFNINDKNMF